MKKISILFIIILIFPLLINFNTKPSKIFGIKIYFNNQIFRNYFDKKGYHFIQEIKDLNLNTIFFPPYEGSTSYYNSKIIKYNNIGINIDTLINKCKEQNIKIGLICQIFYDPDKINVDSSLIPVDQNGESYYTNWQKMVCPSNDNYKEYKLKVIDELLELYQLDYINLDFLRYPIIWETIRKSTPKDNLRNFCFCETCLNKFSTKYKIKLPDSNIKNIASFILTKYPSEWKEFKETITIEFIKQVKQNIVKKNLKTKIIVHTIPWDNKYLNNAIENIAAQNISKLSEYVDYFSPMVYHQMINEPSSYIKRIIDVQKSKTARKIIPSVQFNSTDTNKNFSMQEFKSILNYSLSKSSDGFILFNFNNLIENKDNLLKLKKDYLSNFIKLHKNK